MKNIKISVSIICMALAQHVYSGKLEPDVPNASTSEEGRVQKSLLSKTSSGAVISEDTSSASLSVESINANAGSSFVLISEEDENEAYIDRVMRYQKSLSKKGKNVKTFRHETYRRIICDCLEKLFAKNKTK